MIHIALVEDDETYRNVILDYLHRYEKESGQRFQISSFSDGDEIAAGYKAVYDLILMDINMRFMDGMTVAEKIRAVDEAVVIIFITNSPQYVMKGYAVDALDYVLKPVNYFAFSQRIDRALGRMNQRKKQFISIAVKGGMQKLALSDITYIEVFDHDLLYHTKNGDISARGTLADAEKQLNPVSFFRCGKSYLINLEYVDAVQNNEILLGDKRISISRGRKKELMDALNDYINEVSK